MRGPFCEPKSKVMTTLNGAQQEMSIKDNCKLFYKALTYLCITNNTTYLSVKCPNNKHLCNHIHTKKTAETEAGRQTETVGERFSVCHLWVMRSNTSITQQHINIITLLSVLQVLIKSASVNGFFVLLQFREHAMIQLLGCDVVLFCRYGLLRSVGISSMTA